MGGTDLGMNPSPLHTAGSKVADLKTPAQAAKKGFLNALDSSAGAVHHAKLAGALQTYHETWSKPANQLPQDIETVGNKISNTAVEGVKTDDQAQRDVLYGQGLGVLAPGYSGSSLLLKPITAP